jgi:hypothetical protein
VPGFPIDFEGHRFDEAADLRAAIASPALFAGPADDFEHLWLVRLAEAELLGPQLDRIVTSEARAADAELLGRLLLIPRFTRIDGLIEALADRAVNEEALLRSWPAGPAGEGSMLAAVVATVAAQSHDAPPGVVAQRLASWVGDAELMTPSLSMILALDPDGALNALGALPSALWSAQPALGELVASAWCEPKHRQRLEAAATALSGVAEPAREAFRSHVWWCVDHWRDWMGGVVPEGMEGVGERIEELLGLTPRGKAP